MSKPKWGLVQSTFTQLQGNMHKTHKGKAKVALRKVGNISNKPALNEAI